MGPGGKAFRPTDISVARRQSSEPIPVYASHLHFTTRMILLARRGLRQPRIQSHEDAVSPRARRWARGHSAQCRNCGASPGTVGDNIDIMADAYMGWDLEYALRMCRALAPFGLKWVEEPLLPDQIRTYTALRRDSPVPIAAGEHETTRYGFAQLIEAEALDIIQFDIGRVGGFSEARRVCALAQAAGLPVYTHAYGLPTLHLATNESTIGMVEYFPVPVWDDTAETPNYDGRLYRSTAR